MGFDHKGILPLLINEFINTAYSKALAKHPPPGLMTRAVVFCAPNSGATEEVAEKPP